MTLLSTSAKHLGASEAAAPKGSLNSPTKEESKNKNICCNQLCVGPRVCCSPLQAVGGGPSGQVDPRAGEQPVHPCLSCLAHEVLSSLPLQVMLYFNVYYFPVWCLAEGIMLHLKVSSHGPHRDGGAAPAKSPWAWVGDKEGKGQRSLFRINGSPKCPDPHKKRLLISVC